MKLTERFNPFRADADPLSAYLADFRIEVDYFTHWPQQDFKTLKIWSARASSWCCKHRAGRTLLLRTSISCSLPAA